MDIGNAKFVPCDLPLALRASVSRIETTRVLPVQLHDHSSRKPVGRGSGRAVTSQEAWERREPRPYPDPWSAMPGRRRKFLALPGPYPPGKPNYPADATS